MAPSKSQKATDKAAKKSLMSRKTRSVSYKDYDYQFLLQKAMKRQITMSKRNQDIINNKLKRIMQYQEELETLKRMLAKDKDKNKEQGE